jgi:hypothetical protein
MQTSGLKSCIFEGVRRTGKQLGVEWETTDRGWKAVILSGCLLAMVWANFPIPW